MVGLRQPHWSRQVITRVVLAASLSIIVFIAACGASGTPTLSPTITDFADAAAHLEAGIAFQENGQPGEAIAEFDEVIRLDPTLANAFTDRGLNYFQLGQVERAIQDFDEAIRLQPQFAVAYANRAQAYTFLGRDREAENDVDRAAELGFDRDVLESAIEETKKLR